jgi:DNA processing protein
MDKRNLQKRIDTDEWIYWIGLRDIRGIGNLLYHKLLRHFGSPFDVFQASESELIRVEGIGCKIASAIVGYPFPDSVWNDLELVKKYGCTIVTFTDGDYPPLLREIYDPPPFLYVYGKLWPSSQNVAIVGSRHATQYGLDTTRRLSRQLAARGVTVISGMARGIDSAAHAGALSCNGNTIAVLGCGLGTVYPYENKKLFHKIGQQGAVVSEFPFLTKPEPAFFPIRNRIISGMSLGTVVVEAAQKSGSLITASLAAEQGRDVFAVPGSVNSAKSAGTHGLIKQGAKLIENVGDILEELRLESLTPCERPEKATLGGISPAEKKVLDKLESTPTHIDRLIRKLCMPPSSVSSLLLHLEIKGLVMQGPGKMFAKVSIQ